MGRKILWAFSFCFVFGSVYGQNAITAECKKTLREAALKNKDSGQWDTLNNCPECFDIRLSGIASPIIGVEGGGKDPNNYTDCDSTFNVKLDSTSIITLINLYIKYGLMGKYEKISLQHITSLHVEMICANASKGCNICKDLNCSYPKNLPKEGDSVTITGRLIIDKGWDYENLVKRKYSLDNGDCYCDYYRPEFEMHPLYTLKKN